jgi:hypothetical protein
MPVGHPKRQRILDFIGDSGACYCLHSTQGITSVLADKVYFCLNAE